VQERKIYMYKVRMYGEGNKAEERIVKERLRGGYQWTTLCDGLLNIIQGARSMIIVFA
jgi:hypothetical protein